MGMTIDKTKMHLVMLKSYALGEDYRALENALETMRKYQKIEQIVNHYKDNVRDKVTNENMEKILKVVEDGTN